MDRDLGFAHYFDTAADPNYQDELLSLGFFVVCIRYAYVGKRCLVVVEMLLQLRQSSGAGSGERELV